MAKNSNSIKQNLKKSLPIIGATAVVGGVIYFLLREKDRDQRTYFIFISHCWDYKEEYERIKLLLNGNNNFNWNDYSIPVQKAFPSMSERALSNKIESKIKNSHCIIFIAGMYFSHRKWMEKELKMAKKNDIPVICLVPWGQENIPKLLREKSDAIVGWNSAPLIAKIKDLTTFKT